MGGGCGNTVLYSQYGCNGGGGNSESVIIQIHLIQMWQLMIVGVILEYTLNMDVVIVLVAMVTVPDN